MFLKMKVSFPLAGCGNNIGVFSLCVLLSCLFVILYSAASLDLCCNSLTGTIPSQISLLTQLRESSVVLFTCCKDCCHAFFFVLSLANHCLFHSSIGSPQQYFDRHDSKSDDFAYKIE
jgi:hypothetical protein